MTEIKQESFTRRAVLYTEQNFWYDALAVVLSDRPDPELAQLRESLFQDIAADSPKSDQFQNSNIHLIQL